MKYIIDFCLGFLIGWYFPTNNILLKCVVGLVFVLSINHLYDKIMCD